MKSAITFQFSTTHSTIYCKSQVKNNLNWNANLCMYVLKVKVKRREGERGSQILISQQMLSGVCQ